MKKFVVLLMGVLLLGTASAAVDASVSVSPDNTLWQSEQFELQATCEPTSNTYTVYVENITRDDNQAHAGADSGLVFTQDGNDYILDGSAVKQFLDERYGYKPGEYTFFTACDADNATDVVKATFIVETLAMTIEDGLDQSTYFAGSTENVSVTLERRGEGSPTIIGGDADPRPTYTVTMNGETVEVSPYYRSNDREWVLNMDIPAAPDDYTVAIEAAHDGAETAVQRAITVQDTLQFDVTPETLDVTSGENVALALSAVHEGDQLSLSADDLQVTVDGDSVMDRVTMQDGSTATLTIPELSPGVYDLAVTLDRDGVPTATEQFTLRYPIRVSGDLTNHDGSPLAYQFIFSGAESSVRTTGNGKYSTQMVPGMYNVTLDVRGAMIDLWGVTVEDWDDPIRFHQYDVNRIPGLRLAGLYSYQTALTYDDADLALRYDSGAVDNPKQLRVYRCSGWNPETLTCYGAWTELGAERDAVNDRMTLSAAGEGAYAIGQRTALGVTYAADDIQSTYMPDEQIELSGRIKNPAGGTVPNATVTVDVTGTDIGATTRTGDDGRFSVSLGTPDAAGDYTIDITAAKQPYRDGSASIDFTVERPAQIDIVAPESVTASANTTKNVSVYVENTGYTTITDLAPETEDIPFFDRIHVDDRPIQPGESRATPVTLAVPADASADTHKAELVFTYGDTETSAVFGLTVEELDTTDEETEGSVDSETASGMLAGELPSLPSASAVTDHVPDISLPFAELVLFIIALQIAVVIGVVFRGRVAGEPRRDHVLRAVSTVKEDVGQAVHGQQSTSGAASGFRGRNDGVERDSVMRAMQHIKEQIAAGN